GAGGALALVPGLAGKDLLPLRLELVQARLVGRLLLRFLDLCQLLVVLRAALGFRGGRGGRDASEGDEKDRRPGHFSAASTARFAITVMRCARYSGEACRSLLRPSGFTLMLATASGANLDDSAFSISVWRNALAPAPVTPTLTLPEPKSAT